MLVLGIDPGYSKANATGLALLDTDPLALVAHVAVPGAGLWYDLEALRAPLGELLSYGPQLAAWELAHVGANIQTALRLAAFGGLVAGLCAAANCDLWPVQPTEAKLALTRRPQATKEEMVGIAVRLFGLDVPGPRCHREAVADAVGVALAGEAKYRRQLITRRAG